MRHAAPASRGTACGLFVAIAASIALPGDAHAFILLQDPIEGTEVTLGGTVKSFFLAQHGDALDLLLGPGSSPAASGALSLRPRFIAQIGDRWRFEIDDQLDASVSSLALAGQGTNPLALGQGMAPPRFLPLSWTPEDGAHFTLRNTIDWAWMRVRLGPVDVTVGRQPVTFGRGRIWSPEDLLATFSPTQVDTEFKPGVDAVRADVTLGSASSLALVAVAGEPEADHDAQATLSGSSFAARLRIGFPRWEAGAFAGYVRRDAVAGLDAFVDLAKVSLHAEATVTVVPDDARAAADGRAFARAVAGVTWTIPRLQVVAELYYNGAGGADPGDYLSRALGRRFGIGEVYNLGRYYLGASARWEVHPLLALSLSALANVRDPSALFSPGLVYSVAQDVVLSAGAFLPAGRRATSPVLTGVRSEFGLYPYAWFLELKVAM